MAFSLSRVLQVLAEVRSTHQVQYGVVLASYVNEGDEPSRR